MGSFKLLGSSMSGLFGKPVTTGFPATPFDPSDRYAGEVINSRPGDCILCGICSRVCPTKCITVDKKKRTWVIFAFNCVQCNSCVRGCPKKCLDMATSYTPPASVMTAHQVYIPETERNTKKKRSEE